MGERSKKYFKKLDIAPLLSFLIKIMFLMLFCCYIVEWMQNQNLTLAFSLSHSFSHWLSYEGSYPIHILANTFD